MYKNNVFLFRMNRARNEEYELLLYWRKTHHLLKKNCNPLENQIIQKSYTYKFLGHFVREPGFVLECPREC